MNDNNRNISDAIKTAFLIGLFYGGIGAIAMGALFMFVATLFVCVITLFHAKGIWDFVFIGMNSVLIGFAVATIGYIYSTKRNVDYGDSPQLLKNIMLPIVAISSILTMAFILFGSVLIYE